jgi:hypothetical protein
MKNKNVTMFHNRNELAMHEIPNDQWREAWSDLLKLSEV